MKQTAINQAILMVRNRIEIIDETLMGKHTAHHLQQIERGLYVLLEEEKEQIINAFKDGAFYPGYELQAEQYYWENYKNK
jgi:hypothetical protein